jgi:ADP-glucose pyrophosphorylase
MNSPLEDVVANARRDDKKLTVVAIAVMQETESNFGALYALRSDGTIWEMVDETEVDPHARKWILVPPVPGTGP